MFILLLISQLGLRSDNLILSDIGRYENHLFLAEDSQLVSFKSLEEKKLLQRKVLCCGTQFLVSAGLQTLSCVMLLAGQAYELDGGNPMSESELFTTYILRSTAIISGSTSIIGKLFSQKGSFIKSAIASCVSSALSYITWRSILKRDEAMEPIPHETEMIIGSFIFFPTITGIIGYYWK